MSRFFYGAGALAGLYMWHQDSLGLEGYIAWVRDNWQTLPPWVGMTIFVVCLIAGTGPSPGPKQDRT